jgi:hypothetical protein
LADVDEVKKTLQGWVEKQVLALYRKYRSEQQAADIICPIIKGRFPAGTSDNDIKDWIKQIYKELEHGRAPKTAKFESILASALPGGLPLDEGQLKKLEKTREKAIEIAFGEDELKWYQSKKNSLTLMAEQLADAGLDDDTIKTQLLPDLRSFYTFIPNIRGDVPTKKNWITVIVGEAVKKAREEAKKAKPKAEIEDIGKAIEKMSSEGTKWSDISDKVGGILKSAYPGMPAAKRTSIANDYINRILVDEAHYAEKLLREGADAAKVKTMVSAGMAGTVDNIKNRIDSEWKGDKPWKNLKSLPGTVGRSVTRNLSNPFKPEEGKVVYPARSKYINSIKANTQNLVIAMIALAVSGWASAYSTNFLFAGIFWFIYLILPDYSGAVETHLKDLRDDYMKRINKARTEGDKKEVRSLVQEMRAQIEAEEAIAKEGRFEKGEHNTIAGTKGLLKLIGMFFIILGFVGSPVPMAPTIGLIIAFITYFAIGGRRSEETKEEE